MEAKQTMFMALRACQLMTPKWMLFLVISHIRSLVTWNVARISMEESACGKCRCEWPADRAVGAECAGAGVFGEATPAGRIIMSIHADFRIMDQSNRTLVR
jgi:hypothetical protein